jgi:thiamine-monophosphate kinase
LSLALPKAAHQAWADAFLNGFLKLAKKNGVTLAGGDTAQSPGPILADIVVLGSVPRGKPVLRSGARAGDIVCVTGELGASAAAISDLRAGRGAKQVQREYPWHFYPRPRLEIARFLRERRLVTSMIDISDGLSTDLDHICEESGVGAEVAAEAMPRAASGKRGSLVDLGFALHGGEDYELLFTAPAEAKIPARIAGVKISLIGKITRTPGMKLRLSNGKLQNLRPEGWEHFKLRRG